MTTYAYNLYGNLLERRAKQEGEEAWLSERYEYTPEGLLSAAISGGMRYRYQYDAMGRLSQKSASGRRLLSLSYDLNGNLTEQTDVTGKTTEYRYDVNDRNTEVWDAGSLTAAYAYYGDGTVKSLRCGSLYTEYAYDRDRNLTGLKTMLGNETIADNHYRYDGNGNRLEKCQRQNGGTVLVTSYAYDSRNRLSVVEYPDRKEELFYDRAGNRTRRLITGRDGIPQREELYRYDRRNRLTTCSDNGRITGFSYDGAGNLLSDDRATYEYDAFGRNTRAEIFDGHIQISRYDPEGLRHEMEENGRLVTFIFRGEEIITEETAEGMIRYIRTHELLASDAESARNYYHYASDEMGSITHVSAGEEILNRYEYDAWGVPEVCKEQTENRFLYNGQQYDAVTGQYYLRSRFYNPVIGRFTQEDTYRGDGLNLYTYCQNNPVYYVDPSGHQCESGATRVENQRESNTAVAGEPRKKTKAEVAKIKTEAVEGGSGARESGRNTTSTQLSRRELVEIKLADAIVYISNNIEVLDLEVKRRD